jgi:hypothetical protein
MFMFLENDNAASAWSSTVVRYQCRIPSPFEDKVSLLHKIHLDRCPVDGTCALPASGERAIRELSDERCDRWVWNNLGASVQNLVDM